MYCIVDLFWGFYLAFSKIKLHGFKRCHKKQNVQVTQQLMPAGTPA